MKKKGFTLIELIAVIAILAILAIIAVPRVITYVDRSKKVAIQTEATTIYNAAEAAYNDGKFTTVTSNNKGPSNNKGVAFKTEHFEWLDVKAVAEFLEKQGLLSNVNTDKFEIYGDIAGKQKLMTLRTLKSIINKKPEELSISSDGKLTGSFDSSGKYTKDTKEK